MQNVYLKHHQLFHTSWLFLKLINACLKNICVHNYAPKKLLLLHLKPSSKKMFFLTHCALLINLLGFWLLINLQHLGFLTWHLVQNFSECIIPLFYNLLLQKIYFMKLSAKFTFLFQPGKYEFFKSFLPTPNYLKSSLSMGWSSLNINS